MKASARPIQGVGIGLRVVHIPYILEHQPDVPWLEVLTDNYLNEGGIALHQLHRVRVDYPMVLHGVGLSLGATDPLNWDYLKNLKQLMQQLEPAWISDHLCWVSAQQQYFHELLPLPYTEEALQLLVQRIRRVQDYLGQQILVENVSSYLSYQHSTLTEWEFLNQVAEQADCFILLDINNIYVSATNLDFDANTYLSQINPQRVRQFHLAGYQSQLNYLLDAHSAPVHTPVWQLYEKALTHFGAIPTLIEWDTNIPEFAQLQAEAAKAQAKMQLFQCKNTALKNQVRVDLKTVEHPENKLSLLQADFAAALRGNPITSQLQTLIRPCAKLSVTQSIDVYRDSMTEALILTLTSIYPVCQQLVGTEFFRGMAQRYICQTPSLSPDLSDYGLFFAEFIAQFPPAQQLPYLADVARLEWAWWSTFHNPNVLSVNPDWAALASMTETEQSHVILQLCAPHHLLASPYPIQQIWQMHQDNNFKNIINFHENTAYLFIWRDNFTVKIETITRLEWTLLRALQQRQDLATLCETITAYDATANIAQILPGLVQRGWISNFN
ncbi:MAG: DUF692 family multinuclear iron-containing protein [Gammaproteobacteria bacterium]